MPSAELIFHGSQDLTVTQFVRATEYRQQWLDANPDEPGPLVNVRIEAPDGVSVEPSRMSNLNEAYRGSPGEYSLKIDSDDMIRASFDYSVDVPNRDHLDSEVITVTLIDREGDEEVLDSGTILM